MHKSAHLLFSSLIAAIRAQGNGIAMRTAALVYGRDGWDLSLTSMLAITEWLFIAMRGCHALNPDLPPIAPI
jgi:hypothetical protein